MPDNDHRPPASIDELHHQIDGLMDENGDLIVQLGEAHEFLKWLVAMDDPQDVIGRENRRSVTLTQITDRARALLPEESDRV